MRARLHLRILGEQPLGRGGIDGFAAGALIVMRVDSMISDASKQSGRVAVRHDARLRGRRLTVHGLLSGPDKIGSCRTT